MGILDILTLEDGTKVNCYKQGAFWVVYEHSAFIISLSKNYTATKKWVKLANREVVSIGFPTSSLERWADDTGYQSEVKTDLFHSYVYDKILDINDYNSWKAGIKLSEKTTDSSNARLNSHTLEKCRALSRVEEQIRNYPLANRTPMETFLFVQQLQMEIEERSQ